MSSADGAGRAQRPAGSVASGPVRDRTPLSPRNARLMEARKLTRPSGRRAAGAFLAEGAQAVREAIAVGAVTALFATEAAAARHPELLEQVQSAGRPIDLIDERSAAALSETVTPQGLVAVCAARDIELAAALARRPTLAAAVVQGGDPGNAGTVLRTADAAGASAMVFAGGGVDPYNGKVVRATAGSLFHLDVVQEPDPTRLIAMAGSSGLQVLATSGSADIDLDDLIDAGSLARPTLWLFGNEAHGLDAAVLAQADAAVRIPIYGAAESLNLAMAAAVCLYASARALRQPL
jgi:TrmH family RNA methyltransferase